MVSVVNGYVCFSSCDVAQAKQNKDPNAPPGATDKHKPPFGGPATILDGALKDLVHAVSGANGSNVAGSDYRPGTVDRLA
jgi:hypothetical protein